MCGTLLAVLLPPALPGLTAALPDGSNCLVLFAAGAALLYALFEASPTANYEKLYMANGIFWAPTSIVHHSFAKGASATWSSSNC